MARFNKDYVYFFNAKTFKYNRTSTAFNFTFRYKIDIGNDGHVGSTTNNISQQHKIIKRGCFRWLCKHLGLQVMNTDCFHYGFKLNFVPFSN